MHRGLALALTVGALLWLAAILAAPLLARSDRAVAVAGALVYAGASQICHQQPERSYAVAGRQLPVCARCLALYAGGAAGVLLGWVTRRRLSGSDRVLLLTAAAPVAASVGLEWGGLYAASNALRFTVSAPLGLVAGSVFVRALRAETNAL